MRTTFVTVNRNVQNQLSRRYGDMVSLQEQLATGRRLRKPSDDPIDVANAIKLRTKKTQLSQYKRNIEDGMAVMGVASSAMSSMNELLHRARELAVQGANGTYTDNDRIYMQKEVDQIFRQMMSVINTQFKGNYVFNGTNTKTPPYVIARSSSNLTDYNNRTMATYGHELEISMQNAAEHHTADDTIYLNYSLSQLRIGDTVQLTWDSATNTDLHGNALTNIIQESFPLDTYAVTTASGETEIFRKDLDYAVDYRTGKITILSEGFRDRLNNTPPADRVANTGIGFNAYGSGGVDEDGNPILDADGNPIVDEDGNPIITPILQYSLINTFQLIGGKFGEDITQIFPGSFNLKIGDREYVEGFGEYKGGYYDEEGVYHKGENEFDYSIDYETGKITIYNMDLLRDMRPEWLQDPTNPHHRDPENMYRPGQLQIDFDYITRGTDIYGERVSSQGEILRAIEEGIAAPINMRADEMLRDKASGNDMVGVFLRYSQALLKDDREGIQHALDELSTMYDAILNSQSEMGARIYRFELTLQRNGEQSVEVAAQSSALEDADLAEVISKLLLAESVYSAALQAAMRVIQPSLANYM